MSRNREERNREKWDREERDRGSGSGAVEERMDGAMGEGAREERKGGADGPHGRFLKKHWLEVQRGVRRDVLEAHLRDGQAYDLTEIREILGHFWKEVD